MAHIRPLAAIHYAPRPDLDLSKVIAPPYDVLDVKEKAELQARHPFVAEVLTLYLALLDVQEDAWRAACERQPHPHDAAEWAEHRVLPGVVEATMAAPRATTTTR